MHVAHGEDTQGTENVSSPGERGALQGLDTLLQGQEV